MSVPFRRSSKSTIFEYARSTARSGVESPSWAARRSAISSSAGRNSTARLRRPAFSSARMRAVWASRSFSPRIPATESDCVWK